MVTDIAKISAVEATATKVRKVDEQRKTAAIKKKKMTDASFLRQPGKGTKVEEKEEDRKARYALECLSLWTFNSIAIFSFSV